MKTHPRFIIRNFRTLETKENPNAEREKRDHIQRIRNQNVLKLEQQYKLKDNGALHLKF